MSLSYRIMEPRDVAAGMSLVELANWNQTAREWDLFLERSPSGCVVAEADGVVVGTATTLDYGPFAWISMVLVHPNQRGQGIGNGLMREALRLLESHPCVRLDATPLGEPVYRKLGFQDEYALLRLTRDARPDGAAPHASAAEPILSPDEIDFALDQSAFQADRRAVLTWLHEGAPDLARHIPGKGFVLGRRGGRFTHIGPLTAVDLESACSLLTAAVPPTPVIIDVPQAQGALIGFLKAQGFEEQRPLLRMARGSAPPLTATTYAIAGPELG